MSNDSIDPKILKPALTEALQAVKDTVADDGGTCNFDTVALFGRKTKAVEQVFADLGIRASRMTSGIWKGSWLLSLGYKGQANLRTKGVHAARNVLKAHGLNVSCFYQMD